MVESQTCCSHFVRHKTPVCTSTFNQDMNSEIIISILLILRPQTVYGHDRQYCGTKKENWLSYKSLSGSAAVPLIAWLTVALLHTHESIHYSVHRNCDTAEDYWPAYLPTHIFVFMNRAIHLHLACPLICVDSLRLWLH